MRFLLFAIALLSALSSLGQCADPLACNFDSTGSAPLPISPADPCLTIEAHVVHDSGTLAGMTTYRIYAHLPEPDNFLSAISTIMTGCTDASACNYSSGAGYDDGSCDYASCNPGTPQPSIAASPSIIRLTTTTSFYQDPLGHATATGIMGSLLGFFPDLIYDSWVTIGHAPEDGDPGATVSTIASPNQNWVAAFEAGNDLVMDDLIGGLWYIYNDGNDQGVPDEDGKVLIAQLTTDGTIEAEVSGQYFQDYGSGANGEADGTQDQLFVTELGPPCPSDPNADCTYAQEGLDCAGNCLNDDDEDGICDEDDPCIGAYDACGICNGPGSIYECGCSGVPTGDCDCNGNTADALGVCGGDCSADADSDGICDDVDDCVGDFDACGICNGPGAIYSCGCAVIPAGDCDCNGNQLDALGNCGGTCTEDTDNDGICDDVDPCIGAYDALGECNGSCSADVDGDDICDDIDDCVGTYDALGVCNGNCPADSDQDGVCDNAEIPGCTDTTACNYDEDATDDDGSCTTLDAIGNCGGSCAADSDADGLCDDVDPCVGTYDACGICNGPGEIYACGCTDIPTGDCDCNGNELDEVGVCGGDCTADTDQDGICDDVDDCIGTPDACGVCNGPGTIYQCGCANIPEGDCDCNGNQLDAIGVCGGLCSADLNQNGICDDLEYLLEIQGCTDSLACNYSDCATTDDGTCQFADALGVCGGACTADSDGDGICDTDEVGGCTNPFACNFDTAATDDDGSCLTEDAIGECGGDCNADADGDGLCDDEDPCVGALDACGVCNGPGEIYDCGCSDVPTGDCDCNGSQTDALGICGGACTADTDGDGICDTDEVGGCTNPFACNFDETATDDDGSCLTEDATGECGGDCNADADGDGLCDDEDPCVGALDACGVCNGPGEIYDCGCSDIPTGDCDCNGNQADALGICGGACTADTDGDGICDTDEVGGCTNPFACNYDVTATDDDGSCLTEDAIGECGGGCNSDADGDGLCDDQDPCVGTLDACGVCNGPGEIYDCGCAPVPEGYCDCNGDQLDAIGVCGGSCESDSDGDGICDSDESEGCTYPNAENYDSAANQDDGSCTFASVCPEGACYFDFNGDGGVGATDLLEFLVVFGSPCTE